MAFKKYSRNPYNPLSDKPYKLSRSRIDNYLNCPRCFYMHERKGIKAPSGPTFSLNNAVDNLYKNEFQNLLAFNTQSLIYIATKHPTLEATSPNYFILITTISCVNFI